MTVAFFTHPIGERGEWGAVRGDNLTSACGWFAAVKDATGWAICFPAMAYIAAVDDIFHRPAMLTDCVIILERCDVVVAAGNDISPHMRIELAHAGMRKIPVLDLVGMGPAPRWRDDGVTKEILRRAEAIGL